MVGGNGDVQGIRARVTRKSRRSQNGLSQFECFGRDVQKWQFADEVNPEARRSRISRGHLIEDNLRNEKVKRFAPTIPPLVCLLLPGDVNDVSARPRHLVLIIEDSR